MNQASFFSSRVLRGITLVLIFGAALAIRLYDLTDLPLDFHPTRQLLSAIKARGLYYETEPDGVSTWKLETAIRQAKLKSDVEPVVFERLVAFTYRFTGEQVWIARIYSSIFWLAGGIFLFLLVRDLISFEGAVFSTAYYLLFPYAISGSRSFQPDPLMVMLILAFWWTFSRWIALTSVSPRFDFVAKGAPPLSTNGRGTWGAALLAGLVGGLAIFVKFSAAFFVIGGALGFGLAHYSLRDLLRNAQVWSMAVLGALPAAAYLIYGMFIAGFFGQQFSGRFFPALLLSPLTYLQWQTKAAMAAGGIFIMLALLGLFLVRDRLVRTFLYGLWGSYLLYGLFFNHHVATHDYYHLPFIPIVAVSLAPVGAWFFARLTEAAIQRWAWPAVYLILLYGVLSVVWDVRNQMKAVDYRPDAAMWAEIGEHFDEEARIVALTQDYGSRLQYWGWRTAAVWPSVADIDHVDVRGGSFSFEDEFNRYSSQRDFFLVTDFDELQRQSELEEYLFSSYPVLAQGSDYLIFDLKNRRQ
ncbi:MAG TPA: glycosyltransferase family 39 protein [Anaerolineales bacterium]|nr:glycosyltransferase family 39 protein [Anaerolineales bacterium]